MDFFSVSFICIELCMIMLSIIGVSYRLGEINETLEMIADRLSEKDEEDA